MAIRRISVAAVDTHSQPSGGSVATVKPKWQGLRATLRPLFVLSKAWGQAPYSLGPSGPIKQSGTLYTVCVACILVLGNLANTYIIVTSGPTSGRLRAVAVIALVIFNRFCCILNQVSVLFQRGTVVSAVDSIVALDDEWRLSENSNTYAYIQLAMMCIVSIIEAYQNTVNFYPRIPIFGACQTLATIQSLTLPILQWTNLVHSLADHMTFIALELTKLYPATLDSAALTKPKPLPKTHWMSVLIENSGGQGCQSNEQEVDASMAIASLRRLHRSIHASLQKLVAAYGVNLSLGIFAIIVNTVHSVYDIKNVHLADEYQLIPCWTIWFGILTCLMVLPCQTLLDKTEECACILHGAMLHNIPLDEKNLLLNFCTQLLDLPLTCSPCDFFQLDRRILISVFGTIVTYVIILFQFDSIGLRTDSESFSNATNC